MSIYVFGYGSLLNMNNNIELSNTKNKKSCPVIIKGLKLSLNVMGKTHKLFGVKDVNTSSCNGILFKVNEKEIQNLIEREKLYTIKEITKNRILFDYKKSINFNPNDKIICFYPQHKYVLTKKQLLSHPLSSKYLNSCIDGASSFGEDFSNDFIEMTHGI